jgi:ATP-dependent protease Clp ATPase subunit
MARRKKPLYCSFCRRDHTVVAKLIGGPGVFICDVCVARCSRILDGDHRTDFPGWNALSDAALLATLAPSSAAVELTREVLQQHVELLRKRGVSWAAIGEALGISRQAAWERFA